jgi:hypothetical protein
VTVIQGRCLAQGDLISDAVRTVSSAVFHMNIRAIELLSWWRIWNLRSWILEFENTFFDLGI